MKGKQFLMRYLFDKHYNEIYILHRRNKIDTYRSNRQFNERYK